MPPLRTIDGASWNIEYRRDLVTETFNLFQRFTENRSSHSINHRSDLSSGNSFSFHFKLYSVLDQVGDSRRILENTATRPDGFNNGKSLRPEPTVIRRPSLLPGPPGARVGEGF